jgi:hypothetical protein
MSKKNSEYTGSETDVRLARYRQIERETDVFGRRIGVRRLRPSEQGRLQGMTADLSGTEDVENPETHELMRVSHKTPYFIAAAVCEVDGRPVPFPRNRGELDAIYDSLDIEGITAAAKAMVVLNPPIDTTGDEDEDPLAEAKNS